MLHQHWQKWQKLIKPIILGLGGCIILVLCLRVIVPMINHGPNTSSPAQKLADAFKPLAIPPEELFLPEEPDFLPGVLLGREPRDAWTPEDARPFWTDPLAAEPELWRDRIETVIDELMEGIP
ncbi:MAG: hypothetical protein LBT14_12685 [Treponema sp.]|nr:hypothetical protein [Treponema sp.]